MKPTFNFKSLPKKLDYLAPDTSEIRMLPQFSRGGLAHCVLPKGKISIAVRHKTVSEIWYCLSGKGEIWQKKGSKSSVKKFSGGDSFTIPLGNHFQFRNIGKTKLCVLISTMPKWPGNNEAITVKGRWNATGLEKP